MRSRSSGFLDGRLTALLLAGAMVTGLGGLGCTASSDEVRPPPDQFFFPTGAVVDPAETTLFVSNANSELRYDSGTVNALDLTLVDSIAAAWVGPDRTVPSGCYPDETQPETLVCDEAQFIKNSVRIGNFATSLSIQDTGNGNARLIVPVRGDPSITWIDWNGTSLACEAGASGFSICDDRHRLTALRNDEDLGDVQEEPFRAFVDSGANYAIVTHLTSGTLTLIDSPADGSPYIADRIDGLFSAGTNSLVPGGSGVAGRNPGSLDDLVYVSSRTESRVQMLTVERNADGQAFMVPGNFFFLTGGADSGKSSDSRGLAFGSGGDRMMVINRRPPTLQIYDTSLGATGVPRNQASAIYDICREASGLVVGDAGAGELALVSCFRDGTLYIIDATGRRPTDAIVTVGRGPYDVVMSPLHKKAYVTNFLEDTVGVVELAPGSAYQYREVLRIGETRL